MQNAAPRRPRPPASPLTLVLRVLWWALAVGMSLAVLVGIVRGTFCNASSLPGSVPEGAAARPPAATAPVTPEAPGTP